MEKGKLNYFFFQISSSKKINDKMLEKLRKVKNFTICLCEVRSKTLSMNAIVVDFNEKGHARKRQV